jgi:hypothetical protein
MKQGYPAAISSKQMFFHAVDSWEGRQSYLWDEQLHEGISGHVHGVTVWDDGA